MANKAYDAQHICNTITKLGAEPVILPKSSRTEQSEYDRELCK